MPLIHSNFPDDIWQRLKAWAKIQAHASESPSEDDCIQYIRKIVADVAGAAKALPEPVVLFYAAETLEMIRSFRAEQSV
ncbi:MAG TPA: hypothetical protein VIO32_05660 [Candidatus Baltobacteraceae bacterium]